MEADQLGVVAQAAVAAAFEGDHQLAVDDLVAGGIDVGAGSQWRGFVEEGAGEGDDLVATDLVVALAFFGAVGFADGVGAVQRVVQRAPAGVGGVEGEAGVHHRHHQLRAGHGRFLHRRFGGGLEIVRLLAAGNRCLAGRLCRRRRRGPGLAGLVPGIDTRLEIVAFGE
nr:hypothetical protein [Pseudomonas peli]